MTVLLGKSCSENDQHAWREMADHLSKIREEQVARELMTSYEIGEYNHRFVLRLPNSREDHVL